MLNLNRAPYAMVGYLLKPSACEPQEGRADGGAARSAGRSFPQRQDLQKAADLAISPRMSSGNALTLRTLPALRASRMKASNREMPTLERSTAEQSTTSSVPGWRGSADCSLRATPARLL